MKICSKCQTSKELEEFDKKGKGLSSHCKHCRKEYVNSHYKRNKEVYVAKAKKNNTRYREEYNKYKESLNCTDCGISFKGKACICDFHHIDKDKERNISNLFASRQLFDKEIEKCIPLCSNCHRIRHNQK